MNGSERILSRIRTDCDESVRKIETHAQHEHDRIIADAQHRADTQAAAVAEKTAQKRAQLETSSQSRAQLARRNALLKQRRKEIDTTVEELEAYLLGLGDNEYFEAIYRLAAKLRGKSGELFLSKKDLKRLPENFTKRMAAARRGRFRQPNACGHHRRLHPQMRRRGRKYGICRHYQRRTRRNRRSDQSRAVRAVRGIYGFII